jgi:toxin FitB
LSEATRPTPSPAIADWLSAQAAADLFIATLTLGEIWRGILQMPAGKRQRELERWYAGAEGPAQLFAGRVLPFGEQEAIAWAAIMAAARVSGRPRNPIDMIIAATALANACTVVTVNERDFRGMVEVINPSQGSG